MPTGKPDPSRYLQAAARLGVDPAACMVIEDARAGIAAGRAAGATVLARGVPRPAPHVRPRGARTTVPGVGRGSLVSVRGLAVWSEPPGVFRWRVRPGTRNAYACRPSPGACLRCCPSCRRFRCQTGRLCWSSIRGVAG
ncbi:HAD-IA family hydrolase [Actinomadura geliboluensis]|uniref:HAD-IA family hydrolase n=1 Tax=Actinomadura geliboluensis TaxID=882440 RepID=UPI003F4CCD99